MVECLSFERGIMRLDIRNPDDDVLYVPFSSYGTVRGTFNFDGSMRRMGKNTLMVNSATSDWYTHPLDGMGATTARESIDKLGAIVSETCKINGFKSVVYFGFSMGGYGALLYSRSSEIDVPLRCVAIGTNTPVDLPRTISSRHLASIDCDDSLGDLLVEGFDAEDRNYVIACGELDVGDLYSAIVFHETYGDKILTISHAGSTHNVLSHLKELGGLEDSLSLMFTGDQQLLGWGRSAREITSAEIKPLLTFSPNMNAAEEVSYLIELTEKYPFFAYGLSRIGSYFYEKGDKGKAKKYLCKAWELAPNYHTVNKLLSRLYEDLGDIKLSLSHAILVNRMFKNSENESRVGFLLSEMRP
ncbi:hypothetical protein ALFP_1802 [Alcaligenes faecalis]|nr:hypothetical protein ALFP_1802 [Alcaligenes faecalis]